MDKFIFNLTFYKCINENSAALLNILLDDLIKSNYKLFKFNTILVSSSVLFVYAFLRLISLSSDMHITLLNSSRNIWT